MIALAPRTGESPLPWWMFLVLLAAFLLVVLGFVLRDRARDANAVIDLCRAELAVDHLYDQAAIVDTDKPTPTSSSYERDVDQVLAVVYPIERRVGERRHVEMRRVK